MVSINKNLIEFDADLDNFQQDVLEKFSTVMQTISYGCSFMENVSQLSNSLCVSSQTETTDRAAIKILIATEIKNWKAGIDYTLSAMIDFDSVVKKLTQVIQELTVCSKNSGMSEVTGFILHKQQIGLGFCFVSLFLPINIIFTKILIISLLNNLIKIKLHYIYKKLLL